MPKFYLVEGQHHNNGSGYFQLFHKVEHQVRYLVGEKKHQILCLFAKALVSFLNITYSINHVPSTSLTFIFSRVYSIFFFIWSYDVICLNLDSKII